jgi:hypothetical protein
MRRVKQEKNEIIKNDDYARNAFMKKRETEVPRVPAVE